QADVAGGGGRGQRGGAWSAARQDPEVAPRRRLAAGIGERLDGRLVERRVELEPDLAVLDPHDLRRFGRAARQLEPDRVARLQRRVAMGHEAGRGEIGDFDVEQPRAGLAQPRGEVHDPARGAAVVGRQYRELRTWHAVSLRSGYGRERLSKA